MIGMYKLQKADWQAAFGIVLAIGCVSGLADSMHYDLLLAPFGATSVIAFAAYQSNFAAPRNIIGGYVVTSLIGVGTALLLGHTWWTYALGVAAAMLVKKWLNVMHPPSAAIPIIIINISNDAAMLEFALGSVLPGLSVLVTTAVIYNRFILKNGYPLWAG